MVRFLTDNIDQLDLALDQLAVGDRNFDRFALMLVDNVVELTLHKYVQDKAIKNDPGMRLDKPKHDPKAIQKALGQDFRAKVKFASKSGLISEIQCESVLTLHAFRNTSYHKGLRHESILHSLAMFYFIIACDMLLAYKPKRWTWGLNDKVSHRVRKYLGDPGLTDHEECFSSAFGRLKQVAVALGHSLVADLSADMKHTIESVDEAIEFLANNSPQKMSRDEVIVNAQAWPFAFTKKAKEFARSHNCPEKYVGQYVDWIARNYKWPVRSDPIEGWKTRHMSLTQEADCHKGLKKYCDYIRQTEDIRSSINEAAAHLGNYIDEQIDIAREDEASNRAVNRTR